MYLFMYVHIIMQTFFVESTFRMEPNTDVTAARSSGSSDHTSCMYKAKNHFGPGNHDKGAASSYLATGALSR